VEGGATEVAYSRATEAAHMRVTRTWGKAAPRDRSCGATRDLAPRRNGRGTNTPRSLGDAGGIQTGRPPAGGRADLLRWDHDGTPHARAHAQERGRGRTG